MSGKTKKEKEYRLISMLDLDSAKQLKVLAIRNEESVRRWMFSENAIKTDEHFTWIEKLRNDDTQICLIVVDTETTPFGAVNIKKIDRYNKTAELGFYKTQYIVEKMLMMKSLTSVIDYFFGSFELEKIYSEVLEGNMKSIALHKKLLFVEEGFRRSHIIKEGKRIGIHLFGLLKSEWQNMMKDNLNIDNNINICLAL